MLIYKQQRCKKKAISEARSGFGLRTLAETLHGDEGMVLILTLWILAILSLLLLTLSLAVNISTDEAIALKDEATASAIARGAVYAVAQKLIKLHPHLDKKKLDVKGKTGGKPLGDMLIKGEELGFYLVEPSKWKVEQYSAANNFSDLNNWRYKNYAVCSVTAEDAKAPLNKFKKKNWLRIPSVTKGIAAAIMKLVKTSGGKLSCLEQLLLIKETHGDVYDGDPSDSGSGLNKFLTVFSSGKLYINRASAEAIAATLDIDIKKAEGIADSVKSKRYFLKMAELEKISGISAGNLKEMVSLTCRAYRIKVYAVIQGHMHRLEAVIVLMPHQSFKLSYMGNV